MNDLDLRSKKKFDVTKNVYKATQERFDFLFENFERIYLSFSGGKDSGVMLNLLLDYMRKNGVSRALFANREFSESWEADVTPIEEMNFETNDLGMELSSE